MTTTLPDAKLLIGELFAGYGGLGMGVKEVLNAEVAWVSEFDKHPSTILAKRFPNAPNFGDITKIKWTPDCPGCTRETVVRWNGDTGFYWCEHCESKWDESIRTADIPAIIHILTGGSPCQDLSHAGMRLGMKHGTRSGLWVNMLESIKKLQPKLVIWENVSGAFSAEATSEMEPCPGCVGDGSGGAVLRALGRVLGDLTEAGYDAEWHSVRAGAKRSTDTDHVGAPHERLRVFVTAWPRADGKPKLAGRSLISNANNPGWFERRGTVAVEAEHATLERNHTLLPTPAVNDMGAAYTPETWDAWTARMKAAHGNGNGHGKSLNIEALRLLPTPEASQSGSTPEQHLARKPGRSKVTSLNIVAEHQLPSAAMSLLRTPCADEAGGGPLHPDVAKERNQTLRLTGQILAATGNMAAPDGSKNNTWGDYAPAIARWESVLGRPAPDPTLPTGRGGKHQLSARFVEWMMGLPNGWVTGVAISRNAQLKALGNGVIPRQAGEAIRRALT